MKTNEQVATAFAYGYSAEAGHLYTNGNEITSYWTRIAQRIGAAILMTSRNYSNTTARHKLHIRRACKMLELFEVPNINPTTQADHESNAQYLRDEAQQARRQAERARTDRNRSIYANRAVFYESQAGRYTDLYLTK